MKALQVMQPKLKELQAKFKDQPEKLQKAMIEFYKEHKVNPLSGCLPLLVQLPFFFALYATISSDAFKEIIMQPGINQGLFSFWLANLSLPDTTYILPVFIGITTFISQKMTTVDPKQQKLLMFMPIILVVVSVNLPSGVLIYWAVSQVISSMQQLYIMKGVPEASPGDVVIDVPGNSKKTSKKRK